MTKAEFLRKHTTTTFGCTFVRRCVFMEVTEAALRNKRTLWENILECREQMKEKFMHMLADLETVDWEGES